jgi:hypothetical protein
MGIFGKLLGKKQSEKELYWEINKEELKQIEESGNLKLSTLNESSSKIDISTNIHDIVSLKDICIPILEWFSILDEKECPYHLIGGVESFKNNFLSRYNTAIISISKSSNDDFINARNALCKEASNYNLSLSELSIQSQNGHFYGTSQSWINKVKQMFNENISMPLVDIYVACGLPNYIIHSKNKEIDSNLPFSKESKEYDIFRTYQWAINKRYSLQNKPLMEIDKTRYNLNIPSSEIIYHRINVTTLYEERVIRHNITYSGMRWSNGLLRAGTISAIGNEIKDFVAQDIGHLFITDKRIIFIGAQKNITKAVNIKDVLLYNLYKDGVLIHQTNKKAILFKFDTTIDYGIYSIGDGLNVFIIVLNRILNCTEKENLDNGNSKN